MKGRGWSDEAVMDRCYARGAVNIGRDFSDQDIARMAETARSLDAHMLTGGWMQMVNFATPGPGVSTASFTTLQALTPTQEVGQVPVGSSHVGTCFHIAACGIYGSAATAPNLQLGVGLNNGAPTTWVTAATATQATQTAVAWQLTLWCIVLTMGATGTIQGSGNVTNIGAAAGSTTPCPSVQGTALTWNSTVPNCFNMGASFNTSSASNLVQVTSLQIMQLN